MKVTSQVNKQFLARYKNVAQLNLVKTADAIKTDLVQSQTMPFDTGELQNNSTYVDDSKKKQNKARVVSDTPYARKMYFHPEYNFQKDKNPKAGGQWFEPYISGTKKDFAKKTFARFMKRSNI